MRRAQTDERRAAVRSLARVSRLLERSSGDLSLAHYRVLAAIAEGHERASRVATRLALGKPTVSASVEALCRRGLIERADDADDQRSTTLRLTRAGVTLLRETEIAMCDRLDTVLSYTHSSSETAHVLSELGAALDRMIAEGTSAR